MDVSPELLRRHDQRGPRYTSYPTVPAWRAPFGEAEHRAALADAAADDEPIALYVHLPYCRTRCLYCGCHALANHRAAVVDAYLDDLAREIDLVFGALGAPRAVAQMHWGGGTPNHLTDSQLARLFAMLERQVRFAPGAELSVEADPRVASRAQLALLRGLGFGRVSFGVQDLDPAVQEAIGRVQPAALVADVVETSRAVGFAGVNLDLVYGLPRQTPRSFGATLDTVLAIAPDRVACFGYAHLPAMFPHQRAIDADELPAGAERFALFRLAVDAFAEAGYAWLGLDHFARPDDALARAQRAGALHRDFMGYTTRPTGHLVALGMSGISEVAGRFAQNDATRAGWHDALAAGRLPTTRGHVLSADDRARRDAILALMCDLELPLAALWALDGAAARLEPLADDGLVETVGDRVRVTPLGRYFLRNVCMALDAYLPAQRGTPDGAGAFSRTV